MKFGLFPAGFELPDLGSPLAKGGDWRFCDVDARKFVSKLELGMKEFSHHISPRFEIFNVCIHTSKVRYVTAATVPIRT